MRRARKAFTLIEAAIVIIIIAVLGSILMVAVRHAMLSVRSAGERTNIKALKLAVDHFKTQFDFYPPLIDDAAGPTDAMNNPVIKFDDFLRSDPGSMPGARYSEYSLTYYIVGAAYKDVDGVDGPGFTAPLKTGQFSKRGKAHESTYDVAKVQNRLRREVPDAAMARRITLLDRWDQPIRYYRWLPSYDANGSVLDHHVPAELGDPATKPELRGAQYAIVSLGPDPNDDSDNIVEVGP